MKALIFFIIYFLSICSMAQSSPPVAQYYENRNILINPSFENGKKGWVCNGGTCSITRLGGEYVHLSSAYKINLSSALDFQQESTSNSLALSGVQMVASIFVNSADVSDLQLCSLKNGAEDKCTVTGGYVQGSGWRQLTVSFLGDSTSNGLKLKSTDTTGTVLVDLAYVGIGSPIVDFTPDMVYSAKISATGGILSQNADFIASCTNANPIVCAFKPNEFTVAPVCSAVIDYGGAGAVTVRASSISSSSVSFERFEINAAISNGGVMVVCQKQGADYKTSKAYVASSSDTDWVSCGHTTSDFTGFGTVSSIALQCRKSGQNLKMRGSFVSGTPTSAEARINLKFNGQSLAVFSSQSGTGVAGYASRNVANNGASIFTNLIRANNAYMQLSFANNASANPIVPQQGATVIVSGDAYVISGELTIPIQGWTDSGVIVGSFQGYNETPGTSRVETFSFSYGTTNVNTVCSASPCSYLDQIGSNVTSVTRASAGSYSLNLNKAYSKTKCAGNVQFGSGQNIIMNSLSCNNCSTLSFTTVNGSTAGLQDTYGTILCQGIPQ